MLSDSMKKNICCFESQLDFTALQQTNCGYVQHTMKGSPQGDIYLAMKVKDGYLDYNTYDNKHKG